MVSLSLLSGQDQPEHHLDSFCQLDSQTQQQTLLDPFPSAPQAVHFPAAKIASLWLSCFPCYNTFSTGRSELAFKNRNWRILLLCLQWLPCT